ncbi:MAG: anaerobic ribonucleoside-triphosphate reductase, partial [Oscillospiraceae bacterium]
KLGLNGFSSVQKETPLYISNIGENKKIGDGVKFERIRRITGYLVGTLDRFNDAKFAEVNDRVKHSIGTGAGEFEQI